MLVSAIATVKNGEQWTQKLHNGTPSERMKKKQWGIYQIAGVLTCCLVYWDMGGGLERSSTSRFLTPGKQSWSTVYTKAYNTSCNSFYLKLPDYKGWDRFPGVIYLVKSMLFFTMCAYLCARVCKVYKSTEIVLRWVLWKLLHLLASSFFFQDHFRRHSCVTRSANEAILVWIFSQLCERIHPLSLPYIIRMLQCLH